MDKEEKWIDINFDGADNRAIGYNCDSLEDPTYDSDVVWRLFDKSMWELDFRRDTKN